MRIHTKALILASVAALIVSGCNGSSPGSSGIAALPQTLDAKHMKGHARPFGLNPSTDLHGGGATFPAYAYNLGCQPVGLGTAPQAPPCTGSLFAAAQKTVKGAIYYCLTGSGVGRKDFEGGTQDAAYPPMGPCAGLGNSPTGFGSASDPPDFAGSDVAMPAAEYPLYKASREPATGTSWGEPFTFPSIGGAIVFGYRPQDFKKLARKKWTIHLSTWTYCAIANGTITNWNDPAITADNAAVDAGKPIANGPITFYFRSDGSGTSFIFTTHLSGACNGTFKAPFNAPPYAGPGRSAAWSYGVSQNWPGPGCGTGSTPASSCPGGIANPNPRFIGESGNPGVLAAIQGTRLATGYVEGAWANSANPAVAQAWVQAGVTGPKAHRTILWADPTNTQLVAGVLSKLSAKDIQYGYGSDGGSFAAEGDTRPDCILYIPLSSVPFVRGAYPILGWSNLLFYGNNNGVKVAEKKALINYIFSSAGNAVVESDDYVPLSSSIQAAIKAAMDGTSYGGETHPGPCLQ